MAELTIGFWLSPGNGLLPSALARFAKLHPDASVALRRADWSETWAGVEARRADMGLLWWMAGSKAPGLGQALLVEQDELLTILDVGVAAGAPVNPRQHHIGSPAGQRELVLNQHLHVAEVGLDEIPHQHREAAPPRLPLGFRRRPSRRRAQMISDDPSQLSFHR